MWARLTHRERILIVAAVLLLLSALYYFYFYQPLQEEMKRLEAAENQKSIRLNLAVSMARKLPGLRDEYEKSNIIKGKNTENRPELTSGELLQLFENKVDKYGVNLLSFIPRDGKDSIQITILLEGSYTDIINFFSEMGNIDENLGFNTLNVQPGKGNLQVKIGIVYNKNGMDSGGKS